MLITLVTLVRWNRALINSVSGVNKSSMGLIEETSELQGRHSALARDHEKNTDRYEILREQNVVLVTAVSIIQQSIQKTQGQNSQKQDRRQK